MNSSAIASSSAVVAPGRTCSPISASVSATTRPARAIVSISCGLLRTIIACSHLLEGLADLGEDIVDRLVGMDPDDVRVLGPVVLDEGRGLAVVDLQPLADRVGRVVGPPLLDCPLRDALHDHLAVPDLKLEDDVQAAPDLLQERIERLGLRQVAREAVEDEPRDR